MKEFRRFIFGGAYLFVALVMLAVTARLTFRPAMPTEWHKLQKGMSRQEAAVLLHDKVEVFQELKGFDQVTHETSLLGSPCFWQLHICYGTAGLISSASVRFVCRSHGFLTRHPF